MSEDAAILARIVEYNTGGQNKATIDRNHIGTLDITCERHQFSTSSSADSSSLSGLANATNWLS